jgi:hypothetical protein
MIDEIQPFLGRLLVEVLRDDAEDHVKARYKAETKVSDEFLNKFALPDSIKNKKTPISKGKILKMAPDAFGHAFSDRYGQDGDKPVIGDTVFFIPNESYKIDVEDKYHLIGDCDIVAFKKGKV